MQGPCSPLFAGIADYLKTQGHTVHKINFNGGDVAYWSPRKSIHFREKLSALPVFLNSIWQQFQITDQILFGDCRPVHTAAIENAKKLGIRTHVFECGYFRPYWITLERDGVNSHSLLPKDPDWYRSISRGIPASSTDIFVPSFSSQAKYDVFYHLAGVFNPLFFRHYQTHVGIIAPVEYAAYIMRYAHIQIIKKQEAALLNQFLAQQAPYFVLPLQLNTDSQITQHSEFKDMGSVIELVVHSFAKFANSASRLLIKNHPLDTGLYNYRKLIGRLIKKYDLHNRILYIETGNLSTILDHSIGAITVNSTSGCLALEKNCSVITLSDPIYNIRGLTFQGELNDFWTMESKPDKQLFQQFKKTVMYATQINGGLYCNNGIKLAINNAGPVLESKLSPLEKLL